ncbi:zf-DNL domain-containing protein [Rhizoctonia solani AG-1 IA]|uniref:Zf-DNL domain-containing protein n=1 Tax=Thanatephorus cucumeris (strain AG1-IA) TaxID=983506 RepID=L8X3E2_THACA|nr:zf-DNL domain-containing protein [Rhizoctonia solani AG-1 IA]
MINYNQVKTRRLFEETRRRGLAGHVIGIDELSARSITHRTEFLSRPRTAIIVNIFRQFISSQTRLLIPTRASTHHYPRFPLQASSSLQQRLAPRPATQYPNFTTSAPAQNQNSNAGLPPPSGEKLAFENPEEPRLSLTFTCTVTNCGHRSSHTFTKRAYTKVRSLPSLLAWLTNTERFRHLIADNLDWFKDTAGTGKDGRQNKNIEDIMREKGERVQRGEIREGGALEFWEN